MFLNTNNTIDIEELFGVSDYNTAIAILISVLVLSFILWIISLKLSWDGGRDFYKKGSVWKIIVGFIFGGQFFGLFLAYLSYKKTKRKDELQKENKHHKNNKIIS